MKFDRTSPCPFFIVAIILLVLFALLAVPVIAILSIGFENILVKWEIKNPHVDNSYSGWQETSIEGFNSFKIPQDWSMCENDGIYSIMDDTGKLWALGTVYGTDVERFRDLNDFVSSFSSLSIVETAIDPYSDFCAMRGSDIDLLYIYSSCQMESYYFIELSDTIDHSLVFILFEDISQYPSQFDIAEAIVYSYEYT